MSQEDGHLSVSGMKIEDFEYTKQDVIAFALHDLLYTHPSMAANLPCLPGSPASLPGPCRGLQQFCRVSSLCPPSML